MISPDKHKKLKTTIVVISDERVKVLVFLLITISGVSNVLKDWFKFVWFWRPHAFLTSNEWMEFMSTLCTYMLNWARNLLRMVRWINWHFPPKTIMIIWNWKKPFGLLVCINIFWRSKSWYVSRKKVPIDASFICHFMYWCITLTHHTHLGVKWSYLPLCVVGDTTL